MNAFARPQADGHVLWAGWFLRGYPSFKVGTKAYHARRIAYALDTGRMPTTRLKNTCGVRACIAPSHHEATS